jgi:hypothetical protein
MRVSVILDLPGRVSCRARHLLVWISSFRLAPVSPRGRLRAGFPWGAGASTCASCALDCLPGVRSGDLGGCDWALLSGGAGFAYGKRPLRSPLVLFSRIFGHAPDFGCTGGSWLCSGRGAGSWFCGFRTPHTAASGPRSGGAAGSPRSGATAASTMFMARRGCPPRGGTGGSACAFLPAIPL